MINTLEYDSMRSAGKTKVNCSLLVSLYTLKDIYNEEDRVTTRVVKTEFAKS